MMTDFKFIVSYDSYALKWRGVVVGTAVIPASPGAWSSYVHTFIYTSSGEDRDECFQGLLGSMVHTPLQGHFVGNDLASLMLLIGEDRASTPYFWYRLEAKFGADGRIGDLVRNWDVLASTYGYQVISEIASFSQSDPWVTNYPLSSPSSSGHDLLDMVPF